MRHGLPRHCSTRRDVRKLPIPPWDGYCALFTVIEIGIRRDLPQRGQRFLLWGGWLLILGWLSLQVALILRDLLGAVF